MQCLRRWKRDGSINFMSLKAGIANLMQNALRPDVRDEDEFGIRERLLRGEKIETRLAYFTVFLASAQHNVNGRSSCE